MTAVAASGFTFVCEKLLHQFGDLFELNVKRRCQKINQMKHRISLGSRGKKRCI
jgi:hypothetical protein